MKASNFKKSLTESQSDDYDGKRFPSKIGEHEDHSRSLPTNNDISNLENCSVVSTMSSDFLASPGLDTPQDACIDSDQMSCSVVSAESPEFSISPEPDCPQDASMDSDQLTVISHSSSTPSLSSSICSSSSMSCLGDPSWQYEPLKVSLVKDLISLNRVQNRVQPLTKQVSAETSCGSLDSQRDVASDESCPPASQGHIESSVPPSEVSFDDQGDSSTNYKGIDMTTQASSATNNVRSCLKQKFHAGKRKRHCEVHNLTKYPVQKESRVKLRPQVCIIPIPSRNEYSHHMKNSLWNTSEEIYTNALRNSVEFAAEGWNWRNVTEDEQMLVHIDSGQLIHPVHIKNVYLDGSDRDSDCSEPTATDRLNKTE